MKTALRPENVVGRSEDGVKVVKNAFLKFLLRSYHVCAKFLLRPTRSHYVLIARVFRRVPRPTRSCYALTTLVLGCYYDRQDRTAFLPRAHHVLTAFYVCI